MKKKIRKESKKEEGVVVPVASPANGHFLFPGSLSLREGWILAGIWMLYALVSFMGIWHHEMWRDEVEPWLIASESKTLSEFFENMKMGSNPYVWYLILHFVSKISLHSFAVQMTHWVVSVSASYLFLRFAPFSIQQRALFCFGYYLMYEYGIISRGYSLTLFFLFLFCVLYRKYWSLNYPLAVVVFFLANATGGFGAILSIALLIFLAGSYYFDEMNPKSKGIKSKYFGWAAAGILFGIWVAIRSISPPEDSVYSTEWFTEWNGERFWVGLERVWSGFVPVPDWSTVQFWNTNFLNKPPLEAPVSWIIHLFSAGILIYGLILFSNRIAVWLFYGSATFGILLFSYMNTSIFVINGTRYHGFLFIVFIVANWLWLSFPSKKPLRLPVISGIREKLNWEKARPVVLVVLLSVNSLALMLAYWKDLNHPFSSVEAAGKYITENGLHKHRMAGFVDYAVSPISSYTRKPFYYPERDTTSTFPIWTKSNYTTDGNQVITRLIQKLSAWNDTTLVVFNFDLNTSMIGDVAFIPLQSFKNSIVADENYSIYLAFKFSLQEELKDSVSELSDERIRNLLGISFNLLQENRLAEFDKVYRRIRPKAEGGKFPRFHNAAGMYLARINRPVEALQEFRKEIEKGGHAEEACFQTGMLYYQMQKMDTALFYWEEALKMNPKNVDALSNSAVVYFNIRKDVEKAKALWDQALMLNPRYTQLYVNLMLVCQSRNDEDCKLYYLKGALSQGMSLDDIKARGVTISDALLSRLK